MNDRHKSKAQLIEELNDLRRQNAELERFKAQCRRDKPFVTCFKDAWERTFDAVPDLIAIIDNNYRLLKVNKAMADRLGTSKEVLLGRHCYEVVHSLTAPPDFCPHAQSSDDETVQHHHVKEPQLAGDFTISVSPLYDAEHRLIGAVHVARDITELKRFEEELFAYKQELERIVEERTTALEQTNQHLQQEILERRQAQKSLQESEELHRITLSNISDAVFITDDRGAFTFICPNIDALFGYSAEEIRQFGEISRILGPDLFDAENLKEQQEIQNIESDITDKHGTVHTVLINIKQVSINNGTHLYTCHDITKRKQVEEAHRESEENYRRLFESAHDSIFIIDRETRRFLDVNQNAAIRLGYSREELLNLGPDDINPPMSREKNEAIIKELLEQGSVIFEHVHRCKDGHEMPVEISSQKIEYNGRKAWQSIVRDITERKRVDLELRKLQRAVEQSASSIVITDQNGTIEYVNPAFCEKTGYSQQEAIGQTPAVLKSGKHSPEFYQRLWQTISGGDTWQGEFVNKRKNGELYWESASISPIKSEQERITHYLAIKDDITERRMAEKELQKAKLQAEFANKAKSEFLANMSHELRTPLNGILGYAQILKREDGLTPKMQRGLSIIQHSGEHLLTLINEVLDLSKIESGKFELNPAPLQLPSFLKTVVDVIRIRAQQKGLKFFSEKGPGLPHSIYSDEKYLRQILLNLLGNAVKFTEQGHVTLRVTTRSTPKHSSPPGRAYRLRFEIEDSGIGIPAEQQDRIFAPFEQILTTGEHTEGTGLGLSISQRLVRIMGGELRLKSVVGEGSIFWFDLDVSEAEKSEHDHRAPRKITGYHAERSLSILIVDDKAHNRAVVQDLLDSVGIHTIEAENGHDALEKARAFRPDLIIMDLIMPVMNGFDATRELRKKPEFETLPIIALSAGAFQESRQAGLAAGCDDFLAKPFSERDLFEKIGRSLKLEWRYEQDEEPQQETAIDEANAPPRTVLRSLADMASIGDIIGIRESLDTFEPQHPESGAFFAKLRQLAAELKLLDIQNYLRRYLKN